MPRKPFQPGNKAAKGGKRPRAGAKKAEIKKAAKECFDELSVKAFATLDWCLTQRKSQRTALAAAEVVLAYKLGRPTQKHEIVGSAAAVVGQIDRTDAALLIEQVQADAAAEAKPSDGASDDEE